MKDKHLCPWWAGYLLINPLRKLSLDPEKILGQYIREGMTVIDAGCAMGYFSIPAARIVGTSGTVICVDLQERMLSTLRKRAVKAGLDKQLKTRACRAESLMIDDLNGKIDAAITFAVIHEVPDEKGFLLELHRVLKPGGVLIAGEPKSQVSERNFEETVSKAEVHGFKLESINEYNSYRLAIFKKS